ncbi:MAG: hypothetical protein QG673_2144 [Pseudomonadota bacterium]|nr:hypothetical protein [Pseudomonadota bacterium]
MLYPVQSTEKYKLFGLTVTDKVEEQELSAKNKLVLSTETIQALRGDESFTSFVTLFVPYLLDVLLEKTQTNLNPNIFANSLEAFHYLLGEIQSYNDIRLNELSTFISNNGILNSNLTPHTQKFLHNIKNTIDYKSYIIPIFSCLFHELSTPPNFYSNLSSEGGYCSQCE